MQRSFLVKARTERYGRTLQTVVLSEVKRVEITQELIDEEAKSDNPIYTAEELGNVVYYSDLNARDKDYSLKVDEEEWERFTPGSVVTMELSFEPPDSVEVI